MKYVRYLAKQEKGRYTETKFRITQGLPLLDLDSGSFPRRGERATSFLSDGAMMKKSDLLLQENMKNELLYLRVYNYYKELISSGKLTAGAKLPSIRRCAQELEVSRTTVEAAYLQLAAEGYVVAKPQSGFYASSLEYPLEPGGPRVQPRLHQAAPDIRYDFASASVDAESFDFALWRRYIKSALRADRRLLTYGEPQGEPDLRAALCSYVAKSRNVVCTPEQIVVGAGVQSLLHILCGLLDERPPVGFWNNAFAQGRAIFEDHGFPVHYYVQGRDEFAALEWDHIRLLYSSPSHMDAMGNVMPVAQRLKLLQVARRSGCLVLEDDYDSEFRYFHPSRTLPARAGRWQPRRLSGHLFQAPASPIQQGHHAVYRFRQAKYPCFLPSPLLIPFTGISVHLTIPQPCVIHQVTSPFLHELPHCQNKSHEVCTLHFSSQSHV